MQGRIRRRGVQGQTAEQEPKTGTAGREGDAETASAEDRVGFKSTAGADDTAGADGTAGKADRAKCAKRTVPIHIH
jgi:hypothetical protein